MTRLILAVVAVLALSELAPAQAQFIVGPVYPYGYGGGYPFRGGFGFSVGGPHFRVTGFSGGFIRRPVLVGPPFGVPFAPFPIYRFNPFAPVVPVGFWGTPFVGGWGPGFGPSVVAVPVPVPVVVGNVPMDLPPLKNDAVLFPKTTNPENFVVIVPRKGDPEPIPLPLPGKVAVPKIPAPLKPDPLKPAVPVKAEVADPDPKKEAARLVKLGKAAFAAGDYGRAAEHFQRATTADPADGLAYFLHAQAKFAAGQYAAAVARIREGLARDPLWPNAPFNPPDLYGDRPERFVLHLIALKKTVAENPNQATLEFLLGYELWYSGDKVEADKLFRTAEKRLPMPGPIALFKLP